MQPALAPALLQQLEAAKAAHLQGRLEEARRRYRRLLQGHPDLTPALHFLGVLEHMDGNHEVGLALVQQAHARQPEDYDIRKNLSNLLNDLNRAQEAEPLCRALVAERPSDAGNHANHCIALRKLGRHEEAIAAGRQAVALAPANPASWHALGNALATAGRLESAVQAYAEVIARAPTFSPAHDSLCRTLLQIEQSGLLTRFRLTRTRQAYRRWVQAVPSHPTAAFMLAALERGRAPERMPDAAVKASFDAYAPEFDRHLHTLDYRAPELIAAVLARRQPPADASLDLLDGGCGTGLAAVHLRPFARRLVGVDLSGAMLRRARATGRYDVLIEAELGETLARHHRAFDVCVCVDVLNYFGDLRAVLAAAARALKPGGLLAFTLEKSRRRGSHLLPTGRFCHHPGHARHALDAAGFGAIELDDATLRTEAGAPVAGLVVSARAPR